MKMDGNSYFLITLSMFLALFTLLIVPQADALSLDQIAVKDVIGTDLRVDESLTVRFSDNTRDSFIFSLPDEAVEIVVNGKPAVGEAINDGNEINVSLSCQTCEIQLQYRLNNTQVRENSPVDHEFIRILRFPDPKRMVFELYLPPGHAVYVDEKDSVVPSASSIDTDGKRIIVKWDIDSPTLPTVFFVRFANQNMIGSDDDGSLFGWYVALAVLLIALIGFFAEHYFRHVRNQKKNNQPQVLGEFVPANLLSSDELAMVNFLKKHAKESRMLHLEEESVSQKEITKQLNWSKSKTSAVAVQLERKQVIRREKLGRTYTVELIKELKE